VLSSVVATLTRRLLGGPRSGGRREQAAGSITAARDYFPKGTDLSIHSPAHLLAVEDELIEYVNPIWLHHDGLKWTQEVRSHI